MFWSLYGSPNSQRFAAIPVTSFLYLCRAVYAWYQKPEIKTFFCKKSAKMFFFYFIRKWNDLNIFDASRLFRCERSHVAPILSLPTYTICSLLIQSPVLFISLSSSAQHANVAVDKLVGILILVLTKTALNDRWQQNVLDLSYKFLSPQKNFQNECAKDSCRLSSLYKLQGSQNVSAYDFNNFHVSRRRLKKIFSISTINNWLSFTCFTCFCLTNRTQYFLSL